MSNRRHTWAEWFIYFAPAFFVIGALVMAYGWVLNLITLYHSDFSSLTGALVLRVIGVFVAPIGAILGFLA